jgi:hypothetical protein
MAWGHVLSLRAAVCCRGLPRTPDAAHPRAWQHAIADDVDQRQCVVEHGACQLEGALQDLEGQQDEAA